jgi:hypothetical protein
MNIDKTNNLQNNLWNVLGAFAAGFYTWIVSIFFGAVLLDVVYSNLLGHMFGPSETAKIFSEVSDFLLPIGFVTVLTALSAIGFSWKSAASRNLFIASLIILFIEFLAPAVLSEEALNSGYWIRLLVNGTASILSVIGFYKLYRVK